MKAEAFHGTEIFIVSHWVLHSKKDELYVVTGLKGFINVLSTDEVGEVIGYEPVPEDDAKEESLLAKLLIPDVDLMNREGIILRKRIVQ